MLRWKKLCIGSSSSTSTNSPVKDTNIERSKVVYAVSDDSCSGSSTQGMDDKDAINFHIPDSISHPNKNCHMRNEKKLISPCSTSDPNITVHRVPFYNDRNDNQHPNNSSISKSLENSYEFPLSGQRLLSTPEDVHNLNELHCFVRRNTQVFLATQSDMDAPAPGRKNRVFANQIGLRCIHCLHLPSKSRVKRAVCYPSSVNRIYHCLSDMKFEHFGQCQEVPDSLKQELMTLRDTYKKQKNKQSQCGNGNYGTGSSNSKSTARYYKESAQRLGLIDASNGIFLKCGLIGQRHHSTEQIRNGNEETFSSESSFASLSRASSYIELNDSFPPDDSRKREATFDDKTAKGKPRKKQRTKSDQQSSQTLSSNPCFLATPEDELVLNSLHCFVRKQIEVFSANEYDVNTPAPGRRKRIVVGQLGLRCLHCRNTPFNDRVKRAVCYPPTISGIYHSVSNMKFDHFENCQAMPQRVRNTLLELKLSCHREGPQGANCTAQFYTDSAATLGLVDSPEGIRFSHGISPSCIPTNIELEHKQNLATGTIPEGSCGNNTDINNNHLELRSKCDVSAGISMLAFVAANQNPNAGKGINLNIPRFIDVSESLC